MPSFRKSTSQAEHAVRGLAAIGTARHGNRDDGKVHSLGTARNYRQSLSSLARWLRDEHLGTLRDVDRATAQRYLDCRAAEVRQPTLDQDRQAIQALLGEKLPRIRSELETVITTRAYTAEQLTVVRAAQTPRNAIATELAECCGLRAHELLTLRRIDEQAPSAHRSWGPDIHAGREGQLYVVTGKGGLRRSIMVPLYLAERVEARRLDMPGIMPRNVIDRGIRYESRYDIGGGQAWSGSFSAASKRVLGWSQGGHGCRHSFAQARVSELQALGYLFSAACAVVSLELGHFRASIVKEVYLR